MLCADPSCILRPESRCPRSQHIDHGDLMTIPILDDAHDLLAGYDVLFCDIWGVVHNGVAAYRPAGERLAAFRRQGGTVILVSNAPRGADAVARILDEKQVRRDAWDAIVSSGDIARAHIAARGYASVHHIGPSRDDDLFETITARRVALADADAIIVTGLEDDRRETGESYRARLEGAVARDLELVCANPDLVVHVGEVELPCAGAVAAVHEDLGGRVYWAGKPYLAAYERALAKAAELRSAAVPPSRVLAIGDALRTDIAGAARFGIDGLFIAQGIHRDDVVRAGKISAGDLQRLFAGSGLQPVAAMMELA
jgi:HAD superfamily hydrolase (TIGR01459 family)